MPKYRKGSEMSFPELEYQLKNWNQEGFCMRCEYCEKVATHFMYYTGYCKEHYERDKNNDELMHKSWERWDKYVEEQKEGLLK